MFWSCYIDYQHVRLLFYPNSGHVTNERALAECVYSSVHAEQNPGPSTAEKEQENMATEEVSTNTGSQRQNLNAQGGPQST